MTDSNLGEMIEAFEQREAQRRLLRPTSQELSIERFYDPRVGDVYDCPSGNWRRTLACADGVGFLFEGGGPGISMSIASPFVLAAIEGNTVFVRREGSPDGEYRQYW